MVAAESSGSRPSPDGYPRTGGETGSGAHAGGIGVDQAFRALLRRWWYPVLGAIGLLAFGWFWLPKEESLYRATAVVRLDDSRQTLGGGIAGAILENVQSPDFLITQVHVIRSQAVLGEVVDSLGLQLQPPGALRGRVDNVRVDAASADSLHLEFDRGGYSVRAGELRAYGLYGEPVHIAGIRFTIDAAPPADSATIVVISRAAAIARLALGVRAAPRTRGAIIDIDYTATEPRDAQRVVNAVAQSYQRHNAAGVREAATRRREFIQGQWQAAEARHSEAQQRLNAFRTAGQRSNSQERLRLQQAGLGALDAERQRLDQERRVFESFLERVDQAPDDRIDEELRTLVLAPDIAPSPLLSQLYTRLVEHQEERGRLLAAGRSPTHPDVERLTRLMHSARSSVVDAARTQLASLDLRIASVNEQRTRGENALQLQGALTAEAAEVSLAQEVSAARSMADALQLEYYRAQIAEAVDGRQAEILDFAVGATPLPAGRRTQKLVLATLLGVALGGALSLGLEISNRSVRWLGEMEEFSALPGLAVIPRVAGAPSRLRRFLRRGGGLGAAGNDELDRVTLPAMDFHTAGAEAYRILRTNLTFLCRDGRLTTLTVASAASGEGKSTTAANLAASMARQGTRVLLVDCDLRRPRQHRIFGIENDGPGFVDVLLGRAGGGNPIRSTGVDGLSLMLRGGFDERAAEILGGRQMRELLTALKARYDLVIFDTPPMLVAADAASVAALTDGVLLVVRAGRTPHDAVRRTLHQLHAVGANVIGFVLNDPDAVSNKYGEYTYSGQYYTAEV